MYSTSRYSRLTTEKERPVDGPKCFWRRENHLPLPVTETRTVQPLASHYTDYATPAVINSLPIENIIVYFSVSQYRFSSPDKLQSTNQRSVV